MGGGEFTVLSTWKHGALQECDPLSLVSTSAVEGIIELFQLVKETPLTGGLGISSLLLLQLHLSLRSDACR